MSILIDTGFFVALANKDDSNHTRAIELIEDLLKGKWGTRITTDYILDEAITVTWVRTRKKDLVSSVYNFILGKEAFVLLQPFPKELIPRAWELFQTYTEPKRPLSFTDCTTLAHLKNKNITQLLSFDKDFNGLVSRIH
ncbi:MAG: type II toxin-antitoxin system VapC family toxin [Promethearchaeota archaeon]